MVTTVNMADYSQGGVLFPDGEQEERFFLDTVRFWQQAPIQRYGEGPPHVLVFEFKGIADFNPRSVSDAFVQIWSNRLGIKDLYAVFDHISPWQQFQTAVPTFSEAHRNSVVMARKEGGKEFELVGDWEKVFGYRAIMNALHEEGGGWIDGVDFARRRLDPPRPNVLARMHIDGLLMQRLESYSKGRAYYRTLVSTSK